MAFWDEEDEMELFKVLQMHFHAPSEHTVDGKHYDLELHIVHQIYGSTDLAVLGIFFDVEDGGNHTNEFIEEIGPEYHNFNITAAHPVKLMELIEELHKTQVWHY